MPAWMHDPNIEDPSFNEFMKKLQEQDAAQVTGVEPPRRFLPGLAAAPEPRGKFLEGVPLEPQMSPAEFAKTMKGAKGGVPVTEMGELNPREVTPTWGPKGSARAMAQQPEEEAADWQKAGARFPAPNVPSITETGREIPVKQALPPGYQNPGAFVGHPVMGTTPQQLAQANGPRRLTARELDTAPSGSYEDVGGGYYAPKGMSRFEADARYDPGEGFRRFLMQHSPAQGHLAMPVADRAALANTYQGLTKGFPEADKMGLERYLGIAGAATAARGAGVAERGAGVGERAQTEAEAKGQYDRSRSQQEEKEVGSLVASGWSFEDASAYIQKRRRLFPGGPGTSNRNAAQVGGNQTQPGGGNQTPTTDPNAPPALPTSMLYSDKFGPSAYAAGEAAKKAKVGPAGIFKALHGEMGDELFAQNMPDVLKYVGLTEKPEDIEAFINPGRWSQYWSRFGDQLTQRRTGEEGLSSAMRQHHRQYGTPAQKAAANKSASFGRARTYQEASDTGMDPNLTVATWNKIFGNK